MKNSIVSALLFLFILIPFSFSQDEVAIIIGDREISLGEFERLYRKNSSSFAIEQQDLEDYLERFINFKLKVIEAENTGMDTTRSFIEEFNSYRKELAKPYMMDSLVIEELLRKAHYKLSHEINANHILISLQGNASPEDTLDVWMKLMELRGRSIQGEDFGILARQYSDDPSAASNNGNLGWFGAFRMVPEFEDMAFNTVPGTISRPVRTQFGYHIIKVNEKRPARGSVRVAHIYIGLQENSSMEEASEAKEKTFSAYEKLKAGADFGELAMEYSDDRASAGSGGEMRWFSSGVMIPEFENAAFSIRNPGEFSEPVQSPFGWHIIKLLERQLPGTFEEERDGLLSRLNSGPLQAEKQRAYIDKLKNDHNFNYDKALLESMHTNLDTSFFSGNWSPESIPNNNRILMSVGNKAYSLRDFGSYLQTNTKPAYGTDLQIFVNQQFKKYADDKVYAYEESLLPERYPEYRYILQEYHDGILLFDLTDKKVWSKAVSDSAGLEAFFKRNRKNYRWDDNRVDAYIVTVNDPSLVENARRLTNRRAGRRNFDEEFLNNQLCPEDTIGMCIKLVSGKFEKGNNQKIDKVEWKRGLKENVENEDGSVSFVYINKILRPGPKELDETRGLVISDYQEYLEKEWIRKLRDKYPVTVNNDVISRID